MRLNLLGNLRRGQEQNARTTRQAKKSKTELWPPIHKLTYNSGTVGWQVACMVNGQRIRELFSTKEEAERRAAQVRLMVGNVDAAVSTFN